MSNFKFFWNTHKWTGLICAIIFASMATTGFLLLIKKKVDWIQPPTLKGVAGEHGDHRDFISNEELFEIVFNSGHEGFASLDEIDRVDFRPDKRVFKVRSNLRNGELQVDAVTGEILHAAPRRRWSDFIETIHDGSFFGEWVHGWVMPVVPFALLFLIGSGFYLWLNPKWRRAKRKKRQRLAAQEGG